MPAAARRRADYARPRHRAAARVAPRRRRRLRDLARIVERAGDRERGRAAADGVRRGAGSRRSDEGVRWPMPAETHVERSPDRSRRGVPDGPGAPRRDPRDRRGPHHRATPTSPTTSTPTRSRSSSWSRRSRRSWASAPSASASTTRTSATCRPCATRSTTSIAPPGSDRGLMAARAAVPSTPALDARSASSRLGWTFADRALLRPGPGAPVVVRGARREDVERAARVPRRRRARLRRHRLRLPSTTPQHARGRAGQGARRRS